MILLNLRVHRAGVDCTRLNRLGRLWAKIFGGLRGELGATASTAKIICTAAVVGLMLGRRRIDSHPTHRILRVIRGFVRAIMVLIVSMCRHVRIGHDRLRLDLYTCVGYIDRMQRDIKSACRKRLNRIEGQVRGLGKMLDEERYCIDIVTQIGAVRAALGRVEEELLRDHVNHCVEGAITSGNKADQRRKVGELIDVFSRLRR